MIREEQESAIQQMIDAPKYSFYICEDISYFKELASTINRNDLKIHRLPFLDTQGWRGTHHHVIVDYSLYLPLKLHNEISEHNLQMNNRSRTIQQMLNAPKYSFYICEGKCYFKELALAINRDDLGIQPPSFLDYDMQGWRDTNCHVIVNHSLYVSPKLRNVISKHNLQIDGIILGDNMDFKTDYEQNPKNGHEQQKQERKWIIKQALKLMEISVIDELDFPIDFASAYKIIYDQLYK